jgi:predicted enzyme related to lactoylglutathione lyase
MSNKIVWVDIPVSDLDRAIGFYSAVLDVKIAREKGPGFDLGVLPHEGDNVGGCLYKPDDGNKPTGGGPLIYLDASGRLKDAVRAVTASGGKVVHDIHGIGPHGFRAVVMDTEGNRIALHSMTA